MSVNKIFNILLIISKEFSYYFIKILFVLELVIMFFYILNPEKFSFSDLNFNIYIRAFGFMLCLFSFIIFLLSHIALNSNFSSFIEIKQNHTLIKSGPYKYIRHPMYSAFYIFYIGIFLLTSNYFIGFIWLFGLTLVMIFRIPVEEKVLATVFKEDYEEYERKTKRFIPFIF